MATESTCTVENLIAETRYIALKAALKAVLVTAQTPGNRSSSDGLQRFEEEGGLRTHLETHTGDITHGVSPSSETSNQHLILRSRRLHTSGQQSAEISWHTAGTATATGINAAFQNPIPR